MRVLIPFLGALGLGVVAFASKKKADSKPDNMWVVSGDYVANGADNVKGRLAEAFDVLFDAKLYIWQLDPKDGKFVAVLEGPKPGKGDHNTSGLNFKVRSVSKY